MKKTILKTILLFLVLLSIGKISRAQDFNEQIFYEYRQMYPHQHRGDIYNINDTLAFIRYTGPGYEENFSFACRYKFQNDTLYMKEVESEISLNRSVEYTFSNYWQRDSIYLGYQTYFLDGGQPNYDSLFFEINGKKTPNTKRCDSHCALVKKPKRHKFNIKVWDGQTLLDNFEINLPDSSNVIRMTKDIFFSSGWWLSDELLKKIPGTVEIDGKTYVLVTEIDIYPFHFVYNPIIMYAETKKMKRKKKKADL